MIGTAEKDTEKSNRNTEFETPEVIEKISKVLKNIYNL
jgi:hypothetical protein